MEDTRSKFYKKLTEYMNRKKSPFLITGEKYKTIIEELKVAYKKKVKKARREYRLIERFAIYNIKGSEVLGLRQHKKSDPIVYVLPVEEIFDKILETHQAMEHGGRDKMVAALLSKYSGITQESIKIFLSLCPQCQAKSRKSKMKVRKSKISYGSKITRGQIDVIDMRSQPDGEYRFILNYQDHLTKFVHLRALRTRTAMEVADRLREIFLTFGAPLILQSDNGRDFTNKVIKRLQKLWSACKMVHGTPLESQDSMESAKEDVQHMLTCFMETNNTASWARALWDVQFSKNGSLNHGMKRSPYAVMFGVHPRIGVASTNLKEDVIGGLHTEEDLHKAILQHEESEMVSSDDDDEESSKNEMDIQHENDDQNTDVEANEADSNRVNNFLNLQLEP